MPILKNTNILSKYQAAVERIIEENLSLFGSSNKLAEACHYALTNGGKRFRPALVLMVAKALGFGSDVSYAALSLELFHTASLVADDLPSMDDDDERRQKPSVHKVYGEATALLVTYALIAGGNECIARNAQVVNNSTLAFASRGHEIGILALGNAAHNSGVFGATGGQFLDIYPPDLTEKTIREVMEMKTVSLFENAFMFGWLFGGGPVELVDQVKKTAYHFGMAFQIGDDLGDMQQDITNERQINMANLLGYEKALEMFHVELREFERSLKQLPLNSDELLQLINNISQ